MNNNLTNGMIGILGFTENLKSYEGVVGNFKIEAPYILSRKNLSDIEVFDSFASQPGRYIYEIIRRYRASKDALDRIIVFNPLFIVNPQTFREVLARSRSENFANAVYVSGDNIPIAYSLALNDAEKYNHLILLSAWDGKLDALLLSKLYLQNFSCIDLDLLEDPQSFDKNGFEFENAILPMVKCASSALSTLEGLDKEGCLTYQEYCSRRDSIPINFVCTHHAGDILFLTLAASVTEQRLFNKILVSEEYFSITKKASSSFLFEAIKVPIPGRTNNYMLSDWEHFLEIFPLFKKNEFYVYGRWGRDYNTTDFHLIDHYRFALGASMGSSQHLYPKLNQSLKTSTQLKIKKTNAPKIVLHMGAGWPLKIYPEIAQRLLIGELVEKGYQVMVLDSPYQFSGVKQVGFKDLKSLDDFFSDATLVVGMDSFPAHYASHILKIPTIYLFSSTHPVHSDAAQNTQISYFPSMQNGKSCVPCRERNDCRQYGGNVCKNFTDPLLLISVIEDLLNGNPIVSNKFPDMPSTQKYKTLPEAYRSKNCLKTSEILLITINLNKQYVRKINWSKQKYSRIIFACKYFISQKRDRIISIISRLRAVFLEAGLVGGFIRLGSSLKRKFKRIFKLN
jgi:hypothetical protein